MIWSFNILGGERVLAPKCGKRYCGTALTLQLSIAVCDIFSEISRIKFVYLGHFNYSALVLLIIDDIRLIVHPSLGIFRKRRDYLTIYHTATVLGAQFTVAFPRENPPAEDLLVSLPLPPPAPAVCSLGSSNVI